MNYFEQLAENFAQQLIRPRRYNYSEQLLENFFIDNPNLNYRFSKTVNKREQLLDTLLVKKVINNQSSRSCIVYAHGLGSNKLEVLSILKHLKNFPYDVCSFDFSGSGKSQGRFTSYGLREQDDISAILRWLDQTQNYQEYILWGRSMGSVAIIMSQGLLLNSKVRSIILDSPFSSFEKVSLQIASKKSFIPELFLQPLLSYLKEYFEKKSQFNPFKINIVETIKLIDRKILFIYSRNDSIVSFTHSTKLKLNCKHTAQEIEISEDHNMQRSKETHLKAYNFIIKNGQQRFPTRIIQTTSNNTCLDQTIGFEKFDKFESEQLTRGKSQSRNRGISLTSKQTFKQKQNMGIESNRIRRSTNNNIESNSKAKINLVITQSMMNRKNSLKEGGGYREGKIKPSSIKLGHSNCQHTSFASVKKSSPKSLNQQPSILFSMNSVDTVESNIEQLIRHKTTQDSSRNNIYMSKNTSQAIIQTAVHNHKENLLGTSHSNKTIDHNHSHNQNTSSNNNNSHNQIKYIEKLNSFYSASFMDENLNLLCSINSICLNRKKNKENLIKETPKIVNLMKQTPKTVHFLKQHQQIHHQFKQTPNPSITKDKNAGSSIKRPSIQLRRRNRFVF